MKLIITGIFLIFCLMAGSRPPMDPSSVKEAMERANRYRLENPWKVFDNNWIRGTWYTGVMACYQATGDRSFLAQCNALGDAMKWETPTLTPVHNASGVNLLTLGQTWLESYMVKRKRYKIEPVIRNLEDPAGRNPVSNPLAWYFEGGRRYVDGLFTGPPALAMLYHITRDEKYLQWMDACFWDVYGKLYDREEGLFYRDIRWIPGYDGDPGSYLRPDSIPYEEARKSYVYQATKAGNKVIWSRGNGWAMAGVARILKYLPEKHGNYDRYIALFRRMAAELKDRQQPDGFWYPNLADPNDYGTPESSGTGFFTYALAWGINNGILAREDYYPVVESAWRALYDALDAEGKVRWGQLVGAAPYKILEEDSHEFVTGTFLLAASEVYRLVSASPR